jgi:hypothetical protein
MRHVLLLLCLHTLPLLHATPPTPWIPSLQTERLSIQWIDANSSASRPSLESYAVAVLKFPQQHLPLRMTCGARLFEFHVNSTLDTNDDVNQDTITQIARQMSSASMPSSSTTPHAQTLLLNATDVNGRTTTYLSADTINSCHVYGIGAPVQLSSWQHPMLGGGKPPPPTPRPTATTTTTTVHRPMASLHQQMKQRHSLFASVALSTTFLETLHHGLPEPPDPMAAVEGIVTSVGDMVKDPIEGGLKPVVQDMGEVVSDTVGGVVEATLSPEAAGDMNDAMLRNLVPGLSMTLVENLSPTLAQSFPDTLSEALSESMRERLTKLLSLSLEPKLVSSLTKSLLGPINLWTTSTVSHTVERGLTKIVSNMLTKSLSHAIVPSLIHTLSHDATQDYYAYMCFHHKTYCQYTSLAPSQVFYASYYASYYSAAMGGGT